MFSEWTAVATRHSTKTRPDCNPHEPRDPHKPHEADLLATLAWRVKLLSMAQAARTWWADEPNPMASCRATLRRLAARGLIDVFDAMARPELDLAVPLACWQPGLASPAFGPLAHQASTRWSAPPASTRLVVVTEAGAAFSGGMGGHRPRASEATHDVHLAAVYLRMRRELSTRAASWESESVLATRANLAAPGRKRPDAMVRDGRGRTAIEIVGEYPPGKLEAFHAECVKRGWGYELW